MGQVFDAFSGPDGQPTEAERLFLQQLALGESTDLSALPQEADARRIAPELVRSAISGRFTHPDWPDWAANVSGLLIDGALFQTELDLAMMQIPISIGFSNCHFAAGLDLSLSDVTGDVLVSQCSSEGPIGLLRLRASGGVSLEGTQVRLPGAVGAAVMADQLEADSLILQGARIEGRVTLLAARLRVAFSLTHARIRCNEPIAVNGGAMSALNVDCTGLHAAGMVALERAGIDRILRMTGVRINSRVPGGFALSLVDSTIEQLQLTDSRLGGGMAMMRARINGPARLERSLLLRRAHVPLQAGKLQAGELWLEDVKANGWLDLQYISVRHELNARRLQVRNPGRQALSLDGAQLGEFHFDNAHFQGNVGLMALSASGAVNGNDVVAEGSASAPGFEFYCQGLRADSFRMNRCRIFGTLDINAAAIAGQCSLLEAQISSTRAPCAIRAQDLSAASLWLDRAWLWGRLDLNNARIPHALYAAELRVTSRRDCAVAGFDAKFGEINLAQAFVRGYVDLSRAELTGALNLEQARILYPGGYALYAPGGEFRRGVEVSRAYLAGGVNLAGASIVKGLKAHALRVRCSGPIAVTLSDADIVGVAAFSAVRLPATLVAARACFHGLIDLESALLSSSPLPEGLENLVPRDTRLDALNLVEARIEGRLVLPREKPQGVVNLARARCDTLEDFRSGWPDPLPKGADSCEGRRCVPGPGGRPLEVQHLVLDGFEYSHLEHPAGVPGAEGHVAEARQAWLAGQSAADLKTHFNPQPWRQASVVLKGMGYDEAAQSIAIERRVRQRMADGVRPFERLISALLHWVADYGFNPWKAVGISAAIVLGFALIFGLADSRCPVGHAELCAGQSAFVQPRAADFEPSVLESGGYPKFRPVAYAFDLFVPFIDFGVESFWRSNDAARIPVGPRPAAGEADDAAHALLVPGGLLTLLSILLQLLGATLIAIIITGFTGLLVREDR
ncbi:hypothetical protein L6Q21_05090 [Sandaracinobacter sp. RS1-74]|uniref:hypothetical protein n=1 Tax=Sandaracinobacteroides sayramensis TaxID=2913411 RepID=UPI001ED9D140|nr:hypothetical protein [Sandaracinobacteroides sayramensis]MCG2840353.1 hypothetical protein [Sandaracinobacteroides sayramensis]